MSDENANNLQAPDGDLQQPQVPASPGAMLASYRRERGWTVEQVASQLNLAPRQIVAIEADDYPSLPGMPIVRGFIRGYAKLLKVDAAPLLAMLGGETMLINESITPRQSLATPFSETRLPSMSERPGMSSKWIIGLLLVVLLAAAVWALQKGGKLGGLQGQGEPVALNGAASGSTQEQVAPPLNIVPQEAADTPDQASLPGANTEPAPAQEAASQVAPAPTPVPPPVAPEKANSTGKDNLVLKVREDSWIEVRRLATNAQVLARIVKAGETETVDINEPVSLVIGNAAGVDASLRGEPLALKAGTANVARLNLK